MTRHKNRFATAGSLAALSLACTGAWADTLSDNPLIGTSGDGLIFVDPEEGVVEPGVQAVTFTSTRDPDQEGLFFVPPFEDIITDYTLLADDPDDGLSVDSRSDATNCLMASNPGIYCDSAPGSGKRIKTWLTGPDPFDMTFQTSSDPYLITDPANEALPIVTDGVVDTSSVDYFTFGKTSNFTGARITSFSLELLDANGNPMGDLDAANAVLFLRDGLDPKLAGGAGLPDGLFGAGGNEGDIGFFSDAKAQPTLTPESDVMTFGAFTNTVYVANFGTAFLDDTMVPDGLFWDDNADPDDESALIAWNNIGGDGWTYGTLALTEIPDDLPGSEDPPVLLPERLEELAATLGVSVEDLNYVAGGAVPEAIVAAAQASGLFAVGAIEDLRNANLNFTLRIGEIDDGEFTLRINPAFAEIVEAAAARDSAYQFKLAGYLDAAANVPYWDTGNAGEYGDAIVAILALDEAEQAAALTSTGFTIAPAYTAMSFEAARGHVDAITGLAPMAGGDSIGVTQSGGAQSWLMGGNLYGLASLGGSAATYDATSGSIGYDVDATSFTVGVESRVSANASIGIAVGGTSATAEAADDLGEVETTGVSFIGFARANMETGASFKALFGYQDATYDSTRNVLDQTATGSTEGSQTFGALEASYLRDLGGFSVGPMASISFYDVTVDGFTETGAGAFNLTLEEQSGSTFMGSVGLKGEYNMPSAAGQNKLTGSIAYNTLSSDDLLIESGFEGLPTASFPIEGRDDDFVAVNFGFQSLISSSTARDIRIEAGYGGAFGDTYERHGFQFGMNIQF
ncbi:choice-of-anchor F family protein [Yoonia sp.]|uniref:choice-of-anchor F family protein n=1 Tax=Yoonia sp. TaxID=2212373 RepID=UPI002DF9AD52|nr:choice-of-anchor F family protein [Yoonia sp.]